MLRRSPFRMAIVATVLATVLAIVLLGGLLDNPPERQDSVPVAIESVLPGPGSTVQATEEFGVDLQSGLNARLVLDGVRIPQAAVRDEGNGRLFIKPGTTIDGGVPVPALRAGVHVVIVVYWDERREEGDKADLLRGQYRWEFTST